MHSITFAFFILSIVSVSKALPFSTDNEVLNQEEPSHRGVPSCLLWYVVQGDPNKLLAQTLNPPCTIPSTFPPTLREGWTVDTGCDASKQPNTCDLHKGAYGCYRYAKSTTGPGAQACYDRNGQWISDPWKGAGTVDAETPSGDLIQGAKHVAADVLPFYSCCRTLFAPQPSTCNLYYEKRPPGQCENKPAV